MNVQPTPYEDDPDDLLPSSGRRDSEKAPSEKAPSEKAPFEKAPSEQAASEQAAIEQSASERRQSVGNIGGRMGGRDVGGRNAPTGGSVRNAAVTDPGNSKTAKSDAGHHPAIPPADRTASSALQQEVLSPITRGDEARGDGSGGVGADVNAMGERVQTGFQDLSRLLGAIKETLQGRDGQVQQTLQALPTFLQQIPRIHQAEVECLGQISKQLEHMGSGTRDVLARLDGLPDLLRTLALSQSEQQQFLEGLQSKMSEHLEVQSQAIREGLDTQRRNADAQLGMIRSIANTQEEVFSTFQNTQNRALNVFHRAQQTSVAQSRETQQVLNRQVEMLVERVHSAQGRVFWLSIGFAALAALGLIATLIFAG